MNAPDLLHKAARLPAGEGGVLVEITPATAGWEYLSFGVRRVAGGDTWSEGTGDQEVALVLLGGKCDLRIGGERWQMGGRPGPFGGLPWSAYLPPRTRFSLEAHGTLDVA